MAGYLRPSRSQTRRGTVVSCKTCGTSIRPTIFHCRACWRQLVAALRRKTEFLAEGADEIYVGRTFHPDRRREQHYEGCGRDQLTVLWWSDDFEEIAAIEAALIEKLDGHPKLANRIVQSWGGKRPDRRNCIYVSWRARDRQAAGRAAS
jgi:hypothetical protein